VLHFAKGTAIDVRKTKAAISSSPQVIGLSLSRAHQVGEAAGR
jgi:hypothetical protein